MLGINLFLIKRKYLPYQRAGEDIQHKTDTLYPLIIYTVDSSHLKKKI